MKREIGGDKPFINIYLEARLFLIDPSLGRNVRPIIVAPCRCY